MRKAMFFSKMVAMAGAILAVLAALEAPVMAQSRRTRGCCLTGSATSLSSLGKPLVGNLNTAWEAGLLQDADEMTKLFGVRPHLFYLREKDAANAFCVTQSFPELLKQEGASEEEYPDGTIFFGLTLINEEAQSTQGKLFSLPAILAHEFGHAVQNKYNFPVHGKWRELHADFLSGYFIGHRSRFTTQNVDQAAQVLFDKGDTAFNDPNRHGTGDERKSAFIAGFLFNRQSRSVSGSAAYNMGIRYLRAQGASL